MLEQIRAQLRAKLAERDASQEALDATLAAPAAEARDLNDEEAAKFAELRDALAAADESIAALKVREAEMADLDARKASAKAAAASLPADSENRAHPSPAVVKAEARTYSPHAERVEGRSFIKDVYAAQVKGDYAAQARLARHQNEEEVERRDVGTSAFAGLVVPQYLTEMVAPKARAGRPFANIARSHPLPANGMTVEISRITTGTSVATQATQNAATSETDIDDTLLTVTVRTIAGHQVISRQALDRGTGVDSIVVDDLVRAYHAELDRQLLHGAVGSSEHEGLINVASNIDVSYTDASPTAAELYPKLADLIQQIQATVFMGVSHFVMHPRRWWWLAKELGSTFPLLTIPSAGSQQAGSLGGTDYLGSDRSILGVPVVLDANIATNLGAGTNEDVIFGVTADECHLWEDASAPLFIRAEQPAATSLGVQFVVFGYSAFTAGRYPGANGNITGTGLVTPTF